MRPEAWFRRGVQRALVSRRSDCAPLIKPAARRGAFLGKHPFSLKVPIRAAIWVPGGWLPVVAYRPDIDGLRAVAVGAVMAFHFGVGATPGGFVGVDVFFVISGYLLTAVLLTPGVTIADFYVRRIRRIVPALLVMIALCAVAGLFILAPGDFELFGRSALYAIGMVSNVFFYLNTGYFDPDSHTMPLLHTWSLSVEEQFYLVWPLVVWCVRGNRRRMVWAFAALGAASLASGLYSNALAAFYLPHGRMWELIAGGSLALLPLSRQREWIALLGLVLIGAAVVFMPRDASSPGYYALAPVIGTMLVIVGGTRVLTLAPLVFLGRISYSLYLYHWPVLVFWLHYRNYTSYTKTELVVMPLLTLLLAWASWRYVEQPCRKARASHIMVFAAAVAGQLAVAAAALAIVASDGIRSRLPPSLRALDSLEATFRWDCPQHSRIAHISGATCVGGRPWDTARARAILWGDSNADHFLPILDVAAQRGDVSIARIGACSPAIRLDVPQERLGDARVRECDRYRTDVSGVLESGSVSLVVLASAWQATALALAPKGLDDTQIDERTMLQRFEASLTRTVAELSAPGRHIVIIGEVPKWLLSPVQCLITKDGGLFRSTRECSFDPHLLRLADFFDKHQRKAQETVSNVCRSGMCEVIDPSKGLCSDGRCVTSINGEYIYRDSGHLRRNLQPATLEILANVLGFSALMRRTH